MSATRRQSPRAPQVRIAGRLAARVVVVAVLGLCFASGAFAAAGQDGAPVVGAAVVDAFAGTVELRAVGPEATDVRFTVNGVERWLVPYASGTTTAGPFALSDTTRVSVTGLDAAGAVVWSAERTFDPSDFAPHAPHVTLASGRAVGRSVSFEVSSSASAHSVRISTGEDGPSRTVELTSGAMWPVSVDSLALPYGPLWLTVTTHDAFGTSAPRRIRLYNVGSLNDVPSQGRRVLVDKRAMRAYHLLNRRVLRSWPVATGMPSAPTPVGLFRLGGQQPSGGSWGVLRRRLHRRTGSRWVGTSYYIHGTNEPWSIGMMASHGCVRMFNSHVRQFARTVPSGTLVRIR